MRIVYRQELVDWGLSMDGMNNRKRSHEVNVRLTCRLRVPTIHSSLARVCVMTTPFCDVVELNKYNEKHRLLSCRPCPGTIVRRRRQDGNTICENPATY